MSKYMAREYVTIRGEEHADKTVLARNERRADGREIGRCARRAAQGHLAACERRGLDGRRTTATRGVENRQWQLGAGRNWTRSNARNTHGHSGYDWKNAASGEHTLVSRAIDTEGRVQPSADEPEIKLKRTYWEANQQWVRKIRI